MATQYTIVYSEPFKYEEFCDKVADMLRKGWSLQGGVSTAVVPTGQPPVNGVLDLKTGKLAAGVSIALIHAQAMVK